MNGPKEKAQNYFHKVWIHWLTLKVKYVFDFSCKVIERKIKDDELTTRSNNESENKEKHPIETIKEIEEIKIPNEEVTYFKEKINYLLEFVLNKPEEEIKARSEEIRNIYKLLLFRKFPTLTFIRNSYLGIILKNVSESLESIEGLEKTAKLTRIVYERLRMHVMNEFFGESNEEIERMRNVKMAFKHIKKEKVIKPIDESKKDTAINKLVKWIIWNSFWIYCLFMYYIECLY